MFFSGIDWTLKRNSRGGGWGQFAKSNNDDFNPENRFQKYEDGLLMISPVDGSSIEQLSIWSMLWSIYTCYAPPFYAYSQVAFYSWRREGGAERSPLRMNAVQLTTEASLYDTFLLILHWVRYTPLQHQAFYPWELTGKHWSNTRVKPVLLKHLIQNRNMISVY